MMEHAIHVIHTILWKVIAALNVRIHIAPSVVHLIIAVNVIHHISYQIQMCVALIHVAIVLPLIYAHPVLMDTISHSIILTHSALHVLQNAIHVTHMNIALHAKTYSITTMGSVYCNAMKEQLKIMRELVYATLIIA